MVHDAQLMMVSEPSRISWLTLNTMVLRSPVAGAEITTLFAPAVMWACGLVFIGKKACTLENHVYIVRFPGNFSRIFLCIYLYFIAVYDN